MKAKKKRIYKQAVPDRASEMLVTVGVIEEFREEMKASFRAHDRRFDSIDHKFASMDHRFESMDRKFESMDRKFESMERKFESTDHKIESMDHKFGALLQEIKGSIETVLAETRRTRMITEEEKNRNNAVMDGYFRLYDRQADVESTVSEFGKTIELFCKTRGLDEKKDT